MSDAQLREAVLKELQAETGLDASQVSVDVRHGMVLLEGFVGTYVEKLLAERAALRTPGVSAVALDIELRMKPAARVDDAALARRAAQAIEATLTLPQGAIHATVRDGRITLTGLVSWRYQRLAAEAAVRALEGVIGVDNQILLKQTAHPKEVKRRINSALHRNAAAEASAITAEIVDGRVTLEGEVRSWHERRLIEEAVWAAPGVTAVEDHIRVR